MLKLLVLLTLLGLGLTMEGVVELTDASFKEKVYAQPQLWLVMFSASWCGHCTQLKPEIEKVAPLLAQYGVTVAHVDENNKQLVNDFVVDHKTHMVSYPKLLVFLGEEQMEGVPPGMRTASQILGWFKSTFSLEQTETEADAEL